MEMLQLIKEADDLIRKVVSRYNGLYTQHGKVSQIELDLMLEEIRQLYEKFKIIGQLNITPPVVQVEKPAAPAPAQHVPPAAEKHTRSAAAETVATVVKHEEQQIAHQVIEPVTDEPAEKPHQPAPEAEIIHDENPPEVVAGTDEVANPEPETVNVPAPEPKEEPAPKPPVAKTSKPAVHTEKPKATLADTFRKEEKSLSETIAAPSSEALLGSRLQAQPITDLKAAIGLNERFNFISDLFENDLLGYDEAVKKLNSASGREEAGALMEQLHQKYHWNESIAALSRFREFVHRRFL